MTTDPIQRLLDEHDALMSKFEKLRGAVRLLGERGDAALPEVLPLLREAGEVMNTELIAHARREDEALFAAVEELLGEGWGPTAMMRQEHDDIHGNVERFRETLRGLNEVEHPAIQSGVARLHDQLARGAPAATLRETGAELLAMLDAHFGKEQEVLFPIARAELSAEKLREVARRMDELDAADRSA